MAEKSNVKGIEGAKSIMDMILLSAYVGASWVSGKRTDGAISNKDIIRHLAEGNRKSSDSVTRDIRPNKKDVEAVAKLFIRELSKKMMIAGKKDASGTPVSREKAAKQGVVIAMRKTAKETAKIMYDRVKAQKTNDGSTAHPVGIKYAQQRLRKYGVATSIVYIATGQLSNALQRGKVKIDFGRYSSRGLANAVNRAKL